MKNNRERNPSQISTCASEALKRIILKGLMIRKAPNRSKDPPPRTVDRIIMKYAVNRFTNTSFTTFNGLTYILSG
jgi:hypothetical protein